RRKAQAPDLSGGARRLARPAKRKFLRVHRPPRPAARAGRARHRPGARPPLDQERRAPDRDRPLAPREERPLRQRGPADGPLNGPAAPEASRMRTLLEHVAKQLVEDPSAVVVTEELDGDFIKLHLQVGEADVGKVIGRGGRIAKAIRALLKVMATRDGTKVNLEID